MDLIRDCLDEPVFDRKKKRMGRVDGIILQLDPDRPPRVAYIEVGVGTLAHRVSPWLREKVVRVLRRFGIATDAFRIAWGKIHVGVNEVSADVKAEETGALAFELWLRKQVIGRIPGA
jgi:hypothetical protein